MAATDGPEGARGTRLGELMAGLPLRWKIGSLVFLGLLVLVVLFGALGRAIAEDAKQRTVAGWANIATSTASVIDSEVDLQYERLEQVAATLGSASRDVTTQRLALEGTSTGLGLLVGHTVLISPDRHVVWPRVPTPEAAAAAGDPGILDPLRTGGRYASGVLAVGDRAVVALAVPVGDAGARTAVLALVFSPAEGVIGDLVASARGLAHTGHAELVDHSDRVIASTDAMDQLSPGEHPDFYDPHLAHHTSGVGLTEPVGPNDPIDQGQRHDMAFVSLRSVPWGFALGGSDAELSADSARWEQQTILLGALAMLVALLLVWVTTRSVSRPVLALAAASRHIAAGDLATPVPQQGEGEVRVLAQALDEMREQLRIARAKEAEVESMKEEFLATVSHELRTPLGFIMGYATSLLLPDAPDDRATTRKFLGVIADSSKDLEQLVNDLLDMTKIGSGTLSVSPRPTRLGPLVRSAVERVRLRGPENEVEWSVPATLPPVLGDPRRIEQVLYDLLDNAVKYSPDGGAITVSAMRTGDAATVSIVDRGLGIAPDEVAAVFERFHRGRVARSRGIAGTGLGLAICRGIVEAHGGSIWAESPPADAAPGDLRGTAIRFTLPLATSARASDEPEPVAAGAR